MLGSYTNCFPFLWHFVFFFCGKSLSFFVISVTTNCQLVTDDFVPSCARGCSGDAAPTTTSISNKRTYFAYGKRSVVVDAPSRRPCAYYETQKKCRSSHKGIIHDAGRLTIFVFEP